MTMKHTEVIRELAASVAQNHNNAQAIADALVVVAEALDEIKGCQGCEDCGSEQKVAAVAQDPTPVAEVAQDHTPVESVAQDTTQVQGA